MAFGKHEQKIRPGQVSETGEVETTVRPDDYTQVYGGYIPQRYTLPVVGYEHFVESSEQGNDQGDTGHEYGDGTVPNNTDRGEYGHGVVVDSHQQPKDHSRHNLTDDVHQVMPESDDQFQAYAPIKVEVVSRDQDTRVLMNVNAYHITTGGSASGGQPMQTGLTPVRVAGKDPHRTRLLIGVSGLVAGSVPVLLTSEQSSPFYGFPVPTATVQPLILFTTEEVWVSGQAVTDDFVVSVIAERSANADRLSKD